MSPGDARPPTSAGLPEDEFDYFEFQREHSVDEFWRRFGVRPEVGGRKALEVGCGHGALSIQLAERGASLVVGSDIDATRIQAARTITDEHFSDVSGRLKFTTDDITQNVLDDAPFDLAVSKDTFEHLEDVEGMLRGIHRQLCRGGRLYVGFSPLYYSPFGDHGRSGLQWPWAHAVLPEKWVYRSMSRRYRRPISHLMDVGLNGLTPQEVRKYFDASPFQVESLVYNRGSRRLMPVLSRLRQVDALEKFTTVSVYAVLRA